MIDGYTLAVSNGVDTEHILLQEDLDDEEWFAPSGASAAEIEEGLDSDADELLATEIAGALNVFGTAWPTCAEHDRVMGACSGLWYCGGEPYHDVAVVGSLDNARTTAD